MRLKIWGSRGSIPTPGPRTMGVGGNTSCVEVCLQDGTVLILDAGTGIRALGAELVERGVRRVQLLLTHLHLDHLEGLRFFDPLWDERVAVDVWGPPSPVSSLRERISRSFSPPLFPIDVGDVPAQLTFNDFPREEWTLEGANLAADLVLHPGPTVGIRIEADGSSIAYLPDHEPAFVGSIRERSRDWISGSAVAEEVDVLVHDAQYFAEEYEDRVGWGHSSVDDAVTFSEAVGARQLVLFHHEPLHSDETLATLETLAWELAASDQDAPVLAREGMIVQVPSGA
jgi:phosphoribosyl 1,2-cyclic phosphodiesterase